ncbi:hypothetical protein J3R82DRAFT_228 [Butyriboletus roseoflavus]|nr:hypothetical protein J3R82DRAFT_228 [Butyriboletus roseoflavus]
MAPRKRVQSQSAGTAQALDDNVKERSVAACVAHPTSRKRKRPLEKYDEAETSQVDQAKVKRPRWGRVVGRLAGLMEMPMDILFEIFGHLMPLDVLRLARTTKQFRRLLMHRSSVSIWIAARKNVSDLPDCPPYMSEPQFANLVFDTHCHECLSPNIRSVDWRIGRRICSKCAKECMVEDYSLFVGESVYKAVPSKYGKRGRPSYYSKDLHEFQSKRASFTDPEERDKFVKERQALVFQMEKHGALLEVWAANQAKDRSEQLDDLRRERKEAIIEKLTELGWGFEIEQIPYRDDLSHHRLVKQPTRLTSRIWANIQVEMVRFMEQMKSQRLERERKALVISRKRIAVSILRAYKISHLPLTEVMPEPMDFCAISQVLEILELPTETQVTEDTFAPIVEKMDDLIGEWRTRILGSLVQKVKDSLYSHRPRANCMSETPDSTMMDNTGPSADPTGKGKAKVVEPSIPDDSRIVQDLSLATSVFNCKCCNPRFGIFYGLYDADSGSDTDSTSSEDDFLDSWGFGLGPCRPRSKSNPLFYPKVLGHRCLTKQHGFNWDNPSGDPTKQYDYPMGNRTRWTCNLLQVDEKTGKMAANVVAICGMDPEMTTTVEMDQLNYQLACLECLEWSDEEWDQAEAPVFGWRAAVTHNCRSHAGRTNIGWKLITDELASDVVDVDEEYRAGQAILSAVVLQGLVSDDVYAHPSEEEESWLCAHCLDLPTETECMELSRMKTHLSLTHSILEPQENQDYYKDFEAPQGRRARTPHLKISLTMDRPDHIPAPGEKHIRDRWYLRFSEDELEDDYYGDDFFF